MKFLYEFNSDACYANSDEESPDSIEQMENALQDEKVLLDAVVEYSLNSPDTSPAPASLVLAMPVIDHSVSAGKSSEFLVQKESVSLNLKSEVLLLTSFRMEKENPSIRAVPSFDTFPLLEQKTQVSAHQQELKENLIRFVAKSETQALLKANLATQGSQNQSLIKAHKQNLGAMTQIRTAIENRSLSMAEALLGSRRVLERYLENVIKMKENILMSDEEVVKMIESARSEAKAFVGASFGVHVSEGLDKIEKYFPEAPGPNEIWGAKLYPITIQTQNFSINWDSFAKIQTENAALISKGERLLGNIESGTEAHFELVKGFQSFQGQAMQMRKMNEALVREVRMSVQAYLMSMERELVHGFKKENIEGILVYRGRNGMLFQIEDKQDQGSTITIYIPDDISGLAVHNRALKLDMPARVLEMRLPDPKSFEQISQELHRLDIQVRMHLQGNGHHVRDFESQRLSEANEKISGLLQKLRSGLQQQVFKKV